MCLRQSLLRRSSLVFNAFRGGRTREEESGDENENNSTTPREELQSTLYEAVNPVPTSRKPSHRPRMQARIGDSGKISFLISIDKACEYSILISRIVRYK